MSGVTLSSEVAATAAAFDLTYAEIEQLQHNAAEAAFASPDERSSLHLRIREEFLAVDPMVFATEL